MQSDVIEPKETDVAAALKFIFEESWPAIGDEFFRSLVRHLAGALGVRYAYITECTDSTRTRVRTLASWMGDDFGENIEYDLAGTPCENVMKGNVSFYPKDVQSLFPRDEYFITLGVQSYLGIPFFDSSRKIIGHMGILDAKPMNEGIQEMPIFKTFVARVGIELERKQMEEELEKYRNHLEELVDQRTMALKTANEQLQQEITDRKQVENLLIQSDKHYRALFEDSPISIWVEDFSEVKKYIDRLKQKGVKDFQEYFEQNPTEVKVCAEKVKVLDVNKASLDLHEAKDKEELLRGIQSTFTEDSYTAFCKEIVALVEGNNIFECEASIRSLKGKKYDVAIKLTIPLEYQKCWFRVLISLTDITERKKVEKELKESNKKLQRIFNQEPFSILIVNKEQKIEFLNKQVEKTFGYSNEELLGQSIMKLIPMRFQANHTKYAEDFCKKPSVRPMGQGRDLFAVHKSGKEFPVEIALSYIETSDGMQAMITISDISERKKAEQRIKESELKYSSIFHESRDGIVLIEVDSGQISDCNKEFQNLTGRSLNELKKMKIWELRPSELIEQTVELYDQIKQGKVNGLREDIFQRPDGSKVSIEFYPKLLRIDGKRYIQSIDRDITERKKADEILKSSKLELESKNIALGEIIGQIEIEKKHVIDNVAENVEKVLLPILDKIKLKGESKKYVHLLDSQLRDLVSSYGKRITKKQYHLVPRELEICNMIKEGMTSKEIARLLNISLATVETHRRNIRKKMGLSNKSINLTSYLRTR